jgi:ABC-type transport system involved in multi-copper enzyme maturation permease subunit
MSWEFRLRQVWTIARLESRRAFWSKRAFWVYLLALFPTVIFVGHGIETKIRTERWGARGLAEARVLDSIVEGQKVEDVLERAGRPIEDQQWRRRRRNENRPEERMLMYFDGKRRVNLFFEDGVLRHKNVRTLVNPEEERQVYAAMFQYFYLRLAIFFGCLGIFMNLFRGEMLDKTLHFWFLGPARREVLLAGKYVAGLIASTLIFAGGAIACFVAMLWVLGPGEAQSYWQSGGAAHLFWYAAAAAAGCLGYGSVFLAAGLLLRNPLIPASVLLLWEGIRGFMPAMLQKLSVLYYVQSLCPVPAPMDPNAPALVRLLLSPAEPPSAAMAVLGLLAVTGLVLWSASIAVRRLEINYSTE